MVPEKPAVLIVDDVEANLIALEGLLEDMGCDLVRASDGNQALRELLKQRFAVMLLDVQMPKMDGFEVARYAREHPATREVPIIFLTAAHHADADVLRGYGTGAVDFLLKPLNPSVLRAKVRVFLDLHLGRQKLAREIEAHRETLRALERANLALRHFAQAAAHDLRAPLRSIRCFLDALALNASDKLDDRSRDYLDRSRRASARMDALLSALRTYAGLQRPVEHGAVDCNEVLEQVLTDLADRITATGATVLVDPLPTITGDPSRLYQLFANLVSNALKFQPPGVPPTVQVTASPRGREWVFCVADNGIGIDPQHHASVFEAFQRLHDEATYEGSGLGLAICQQIVQQHEGRIWLESALGGGARFFFAVPVR